MTNLNNHTLFCDYLDLLRVPHTVDYSNRRFSEMPFKTMFGLKKLLQEYGVPSDGYLLEDKEEFSKLTPPFLARTPKGFVAVAEITPDSVSYISEGERETAGYAEFLQAQDGNVFLSFPEANATEPDYKLHYRIDFFNRIKKWILACGLLFLFLYFYITDQFYRSLSVSLILAIDLLGLYFTYLLVQKSVNIKNRAADRVCGILQAGGCDDVLSLKASKFFGIFGWSEVGFAYFSVSLLTLFFFPWWIKWLALCNLCCLPFTFWSIWYQKFRAKRWCTLCVCVQCSLWLLFFCYLFGGWLKDIWPLNISFFALGAAYLSVMLALNAVMPLMEEPHD